MVEVKNCKHQAFTQLSMIDMAKKLDEFSAQEDILVIATQVFLRNGKYDALVYYREIGEEKQEIEKIPYIKDGKPPYQDNTKSNGSKQIGALWRKKTILSGKLNGEKFSIKVDEFDRLEQRQSKTSHKIMRVHEFEGQKLLIMKNTFKNPDEPTDASKPDYVIYPGGE